MAERLLQHPLFQRSRWNKKNGEERLDRDELTEGSQLDAQAVVEELQLNGARLAFDQEDNLTHVSLLHSKWNEPKKLVDPGLVLLEHLPHLRFVSLYNTAVTDHGLRHLAKLTRLTGLGLGWTGVGDVGLSHLQHLTELETLGLVQTQVSDAGLVYLKHMTRLRVLNLEGSKVTDEGLVHLEKLTNLKEVNVQRTKVTDKGADRLQAALPNCTISH